jgi:predicted acyl esterase
VWTRRHLDARDLTLHDEPLPPFAHETELTGPLAARLHVSSDTVDADLFLTVRVFDPAGDEVLFQGAIDPKTPLAQGWLRTSHRALDPGRSTPHQPFHLHDAPDL